MRPIRYSSTRRVIVRKFAKLSSILVLAIGSASAAAVSVPFNNLSHEDMNKIVGDMSANFLHTSVSGASSLGRIFGFEVGLKAGKANTPNLKDVVANYDPGTKVDSLPHASLLGVLTVPLGITVEMGLVPKVGSDEFKYSTNSLAAKWTPTDTILDLPFSLAGKVSYSVTNLDTTETINSVVTKYNFEDKVTAFTALISKDFIIVEPYFGIGMASAKGNLSATGATTVFQAGVSGEANRSSSLWLVGAEVKLLIFKLGAEYANVFGASSYTGKLSFYF